MVHQQNVTCIGVVTHNQQQIWNTDIVMKLIQPMKLVEITNQFFKCVLVYNHLPPWKQLPCRYC